LEWINMWYSLRVTGFPDFVHRSAI
jgi:hypothetical protein